MSRLQCLMESLEEAEKAGYKAAMRGKPLKPAPNVNDFVNQHPENFRSANLYHERWTKGWMSGSKNSSHQPSP